MVLGQIKQGEPVVVIPLEIAGKNIKHKFYGKGVVTAVTDTVLVVSFDSVGEKKLGYEVCIKNKLIKIL